MLDQLKAMQALAALAKNKDKLEATMLRVKEELADLRVEGEAGSGAVRATVSGTMKIVSVDLSPALVAGTNVDAKTRELAGDLIAQAINDANQRAQAKAREIVQREAQDLGIPGLENMLSDSGALGNLLG